ncbi:hypothetical protein ACJMK2_024060 [Sinanodonta woodiana]|uniref:non-specific serine/threonine protein kinase n=1 Tax=Sinanodonta woodiana TaxID=1069815 RepID=A0ABD3T679_SINWO
MNGLGLGILFRMGCVCGKETIEIENRRYIVRSRLAEGGFSVIDLLEDVVSHKLMAQKRITCHGDEDERIAMREVEIMRSFQDPHVVPLVGHTMIKVSSHTRPYEVLSEVLIVMPYYRKGSIQDRIDILKKKSDKMGEHQLWKIFQGICHGVRVIHSYNPPYAHRDLKPANVMLADDDTPVLMDLGSAAKARVYIQSWADAHRLQDEAAERCSMLYRAPELFHVEMGDTVDERSDIWSLGCVLYAMAFQESPFEQVYQRGDSIPLAVTGGNVRFPENSGFSDSVQEVVLECMVVNHKNRPYIDHILSKVELTLSGSHNAHDA